VGTIKSLNGFGGALLFAASSHTDQLTRVTITDGAGDDFAIAQQRYGTASAVPEPSLGAATAALLAGISVLLRRRKK
jgi:hypothetical protein